VPWAHTSAQVSDCKPGHPTTKPCSESGLQDMVKFTGLTSRVLKLDYVLADADVEAVTVGQGSGRK
jgi:hypothetical protein